MQEKIISIGDSITVGELASALNLPVTTLIGELFKNGIIATINQKIDYETATIIIEELGIDAKLQHKQSDSEHLTHKVRKSSDKAVERPPIVAVMGHVDHGKTSLLDALLDKDTVDSEAGGITQHISAYQADYKGRKITLLDTPGHEAFAALRQHGAILTDVVIIVVAADDGVKPQTVEAIKFARNANAKIVVAINKIDKDTANPQLVKTQLASEHGLNPEEWGGDTIMVEISAKKKMNLDKLLENVLLVADMEELKADDFGPGEGLVVEAHKEVGKGPVVNLLVGQGKIAPGNYIVAGSSYGKVRTLQDFKGMAIKSAGPSSPVTVTGFKLIPEFGDVFKIVKSEKEAKALAHEVRLEREREAAETNVTSADILKRMNQKYDSQEFNVIVKADVQGSLTSVIDSLKLIETNGEVNLRIVGSGVGNISENDVRLASDENTIIYGFSVNLPSSVKRLAARYGVSVRIFDVIYELLDDAKEEMSNLLQPEIKEIASGQLKVKGVFRTTKTEIIAGGEVKSGKILAGLLARVYRKKDLIAEDLVLEKVQREQTEVKEVHEGDLCGISLKTHKKLQIEVGDKIEFYSKEIIKRKLK